MINDWFSSATPIPTARTARPHARTLLPSLEVWEQITCPLRPEPTCSATGRRRCETCQGRGALVLGLAGRPRVVRCPVCRGRREVTCSAWSRKAR